MRIYYVIRDTSPVKKTKAERENLIDRLPAKALDGPTVDSRLNPIKISRDGSLWFGGIVLDSGATGKLDNMEKGQGRHDIKLATVLQRELRSLLAPSDRGRVTVEIVGYDSPTTSAVLMASQWLEANWDYSEVTRPTKEDTKR